MKKLISFFIVSVIAGILPAYAHPPSKIEVNVKNKMVNVMVSHSVSNPLRHYIYKLDVYLNGNKVIEQKFGLQEGNAQRAVFYIPSLKSSDELGIEAYCNKFGQLRKDIKVK